MRHFDPEVLTFVWLQTGLSITVACQCSAVIDDDIGQPAVRLLRVNFRPDVTPCEKMSLPEVTLRTMIRWVSLPVAR